MLESEKPSVTVSPQRQVNETGDGTAVPCEDDTDGTLRTNDPLKKADFLVAKATVSGKSVKIILKILNILLIVRHVQCLYLNLYDDRLMQFCTQKTMMFNTEYRLFDH